MLHGGDYHTGSGAYVALEVKELLVGSGARQHAPVAPENIHDKDWQSVVESST